MQILFGATTHLLRTSIKYACLPCINKPFLSGNRSDDLIQASRLSSSVAALNRHRGVLEPIFVGAVVVVHVRLLDVLVGRTLPGGQPPVPVGVPLPPPVTRVARRRAGVGAGVDVEALVPRGGGRAVPVDLDPAAVRRPFGTVPQARPDAHPLRRELVLRHTARQVPEHPYRHIVDEYPAKCSYMIRISMQALRF